MGLTLSTSGWPTLWFWGGLPCKKRHAEEGILHILGSSLTCRCVWASHSRRMCAVEEMQFGAEAQGTLLLSRDWRSAEKHVFLWHDGNSKTEATCEKWECQVHHRGRRVWSASRTCFLWGAVAVAQMPVRLSEVATLWSQRFVVGNSKGGSGEWQKVHTKYLMASQTECWGRDSLILSTLYGIGMMLVAWTPYWTPHNGAFRGNTQRSKKQKLTHPPIMVPQIIVKVFVKWDKEKETQVKMQWV